MVYYVTIECYKNCTLQLMLKGFNQNAEEKNGNNQEEDDSNIEALIDANTN